ncbi:apolipoprotein N-acyltransferase [Rhizomicrobium palustre]|uniref:Apolipoprotein N-acyltransferase n=1 Tax=Rhizomicrobium palustre TaxID=189966 RepID=A0A846MYD1_9PROT|nr:apolipoprotein N-acyltransferase [Rhizomicrobium palustre]NIK88121.1 apolipoprotein N-acyltransferase [Rhizomicrobium palustre]
MTFLRNVVFLLAKTGHWFRALKGWRRFGMAVAAGAFSALGFAPFSFFPALLFGFAALVLLLEAAATEPKKLSAAFRVGFWFGFGQFLVGLHWIGYAFLVDAESHAWQIPFVALLFPGGLALFIAAAALLAVRFSRPGLSRVLAVSAAYALSEWLRGHILTGFPWNIAGYGWGASLAVLQSASVIGVYGLSLLTVLFGCSLALLFASKPRFGLAGAMALVFTFLFVGGAIRLGVTPEQNKPAITIRLVQPDIPQAEKYQRKYIVRNWRRLLDLSAAPGKPSIIIWPEAAPPFLLNEQPLALDQIGRLTEGRLGLMTGGLRREFLPNDEMQLANSFFVYGQAGILLDSYDKSHLVPFGEYLPFEKTLTALGLSKLTGIEGGFIKGAGPRVMALPGAGNVTALICYEILFPGEVEGAKRPDWFVNVTDDSWFGPWAGPRQHLLVARVRAIEEGVPVVRDANTGISAIIDPLGRIRQSLGLGKMGFIDGPLPAPLAPTPYSQSIDLFFWLVLIAMIALTARLYRAR